ncbi:MAG: magnesium transporter [bacterium]|nr:MAG: magnesium transporter [bacterium]
MPHMTEEKIEDELVKKLIEGVLDIKNLDKRLGQMRPGDVSELIEKLPEKLKIEVFQKLEPETASEILLTVNNENREILLEKMTTPQITGIVEEMDSDDAADFVSDLSDEQAREVLKELPPQESAEVRSLLDYPEDSAGGIMQLELVSLHDTQTCQDAIGVIRSKSEDVEELHNVFVMDSFNRLVGTVPLRKLILHSPGKPIREIMDPDPVSVGVTGDQETVAKIFRKYDVVSLPVVDEEGRLLGRILHDDVLDVITEIDTEDLLKVAGTDDEEFESASWLNAARYRLPWLLTSLVGGIFMAAIINALGAPIKQTVSLAAFIPVILGMGGNVSTQSSAIAVRSLSLGKINGSGIRHFILKELRVGFAMAVFCGTLIGAIATAINVEPEIGIVVGASLFASMAFASMMGTMVPLILHKLKVDPVLGAGPIVLTMADIAGLLIYFGLAAVLLRAFV